MLTSEFHHRAHAFLDSLLRQRDYLIITHKNRKNLAEVQYAASFIRLHLHANGYHNNRQMAQFWEKHQDKIRMLLPGVGSPVHLSMRERFDSLLWEAGLYQPTIFQQSPQFDYPSSM
jgi:hypothetical protein